MAQQYTLPKQVANTGKDDVYRALENIAKQLERQNSPNIATNVRQYMRDREKLINNHRGKYAQISEHGIEVIDITNLSDSDVGFNSKFNGLMLKIGQELEHPVTPALYSRTYNVPTQVYKMPLSFGNRNDTGKLWVSNMDAVVDTGCSTTVFDESVIGWIRGSGYNYATVPVTLNVVGGKADVQAARIDLDICSTPFTGINVNFANLNGRVALIGTDLLNSGKLDLDSGVRLSFTKH